MPAVKCSQLIKLLLRPRIERMIVALSANDLLAQHDADGVVDVRKGHSIVADLETNGRVFPDFTVGCRAFMNPLVVGLILGNRLLDVSQVRFEDDVVVRTLGESKNIGQ